MKKNVVVTGASGFIGGLLLDGLAGTYQVRALARRPLSGAQDAVVADIQDLEALQAAFQGADSVVHMAASASYLAPWEAVLPNNIIGVYNVYEAALRAGVQQVIFASSNHAVGAYELEDPSTLYRSGQPVLDHNVPLRPDGLYGVSKGFGESLGRYYAEYHGLRVICLRIGFVNRDDTPYPPRYWEDPERLAAIWLSQRDCVQLVDKSLQAEHVKFDVFYGISRNQPHFYDLEHGKNSIGYEPQDSGNVSKARKQAKKSSEEQV